MLYVPETFQGPRQRLQPCHRQRSAERQVLLVVGKWFRDQHSSCKDLTGAHFCKGLQLQPCKARGWARDVLCVLLKLSHPQEVEDVVPSVSKGKPRAFFLLKTRDKTSKCVKNALIKDLIFKGKNSINDLIKKWSNCFHNCFLNYQGLFSSLVIVHGVINHNPGDHSALDNLQPYSRVRIQPGCDCWRAVPWAVDRCKIAQATRIPSSQEVFLLIFFDAYLLLFLWALSKNTGTPRFGASKSGYGIEYEFSSVPFTERWLWWCEAGKVNDIYFIYSKMNNVYSKKVFRVFHARCILTSISEADFHQTWEREKDEISAKL